MFLLCISAEPDAPFPRHFSLRGRKRDKSCEKETYWGWLPGLPKSSPLCRLHSSARLCCLVERDLHCLESLSNNDFGVCGTDICPESDPHIPQVMLLCFVDRRHARGGGKPSLVPAPPFLSSHLSRVTLIPCASAVYGIETVTCPLGCGDHTELAHACLGQSSHPALEVVIDMTY